MAECCLRTCAAGTSIKNHVFPSNMGYGTALSEAIGERVESINVQAFGAKGDGTTDDRAAIQAAPDYLRSRGRSRGVAFFPIGDYRVLNTIKIPTGVSLRGPSGGFWVCASIGRSRIFIDPSVDAPALQNASALTTYDATIIIENLYIDGTTSGTASALDLRGTSRASGRFIISNCFVTSLGGGGIHLQNVQTSIVGNCYVSNTKGHAVRLDNCYDNEVTGNQIDTYNATTQTVNPGDGIMLSGVSPNNIISNNFVLLANPGIAVLYGHTNTFTGNRINTCNIGILLQNFIAADKVRQDTFVSNALYDHGFVNGFVGVFVDGLASANTFVGNTVGENRTGTARMQNHGIRATASTVGNVFTGNVSSNSKTSNFGILSTNSHFGNNEGAQSGFHVGDGPNVVIGSTLGTQIDSASSRMAFFGATPIVKPSGVPVAATTQPLVNDLRLKMIHSG